LGSITCIRLFFLQVNLGQKPMLNQYKSRHTWNSTYGIEDMTRYRQEDRVKSRQTDRQITLAQILYSQNVSPMSGAMKSRISEPNSNI
jgi:plasmid replication initiation protein